jgi:hypothetical protein
MRTAREPRAARWAARPGRDFSLLLLSSLVGVFTPFDSNMKRQLSTLTARRVAAVSANV